MATRVRRVTDFAKHGMNYLLRRDQVAPLEKERNKEKEWLKAHINANGQVDDAGNRNVYFDSPVPGPGTTTYYGLQQRRSPGAAYMDTEEIKRFVKKLDPELQERVVYKQEIEVVDAEELYRLHYEKKISEAELRKLEHHYDDSFQLWPITDPPLEEI